MDTDNLDSDGSRLRDRAHCQVHRETANNLQKYREGKTQMRRNLKEARQKAGMTQKQVAEYLGIHERYYQHIEAGQRTGDFTLWDMLEDLFNVHQRKLREIEDNHSGKAVHPVKHIK